MSFLQSLPDAVKKPLRPLPQMVPIALCAPQHAVNVFLMVAGRTVDVTLNCVVASLAPFRVAIGTLGLPSLGVGEAELSFKDISSGMAVGYLTLRLDTTWHQDTRVELAIFDVTGGAHSLTRWPYRAWNQWLQDRSFRRKSAGTLNMTAEGVQHTTIFYTCPRPVVLVSVIGAGHSNLFPMDLIGPIAEDRFTLALRSTSASIPTMKATGRVAISDMPAALTPAVYKLGEHHKKPVVDWSELPFEMRRSSLFSLPHPASALRVRELDILAFMEVGGHTVFMTRIASDECYTQGAQLFHVNGSYQHYRTKLAKPFALAN